jgi:hypothetical protein
MGMLLSDVRLATPHLQTGRALYRPRRAARRSALPRERFSPVGTKLPCRSNDRTSGLGPKAGVLFCAAFAWN